MLHPRSVKNRARFLISEHLDFYILSIVILTHIGSSSKTSLLIVTIKGIIGRFWSGGGQRDVIRNKVTQRDTFPITVLLQQMVLWTNSVPPFNLSYTNLGLVITYANLHITHKKRSPQTEIIEAFFLFDSSINLGLFSPNNIPLRMNCLFHAHKTVQWIEKNKHLTLWF
ncbi:hypothetical protein XELAEV_18024153mg [Xenopus laevis]|uniref:Uncharacterized protein n=1 Tax=Xenopus laevis TaxID=8355 RepID=A0A974HQ99_XENLA|nr:hypothetical protein XELAEV_18024153mg [Xenopus laevis]